MKSFENHTEQLCKDESFREIFDEERELADLAVRIAMTRQQSGMSQVELAKRAHVTQQQVSRIESGSNCNLLTLIKILHALQLKVDIAGTSALA